MTAPARLARLSRTAVIAAVALVGAGLLAVVWSMNHAVRSASESVIRGETSTLQRTLRAELNEPGDVSRAERLPGILDGHAADGLRYLAELDADGHVIADAGQASTDRATLEAWIAAATPSEPVEIDGRARVVYRRRGPRPDRPDRADDDARGRRDSGRIAGLLFELEPPVADELRASARWLLGLGGAAALLLIGLSALLVRWSFAREREVRAAEQARHLATLGQLSAVMAHEIRNPLASLKGNAQLLARSLPEGDKPRAKADRVVSEATRLETLTNDLLEFARVGEIRRADVDPTALVRDAAAAIAPDRIDIDASDAPPTWPLDADRLRQVVVNLLENAVEMSEAPVEVRIARAGGDLHLAVRDHGPGIAAADLPHLFEPFFTRRTRGTGLGLAVSRRLVELHGGTITARAADGGGALFEVSLPRR